MVQLQEQVVVTAIQENQARMQTLESSTQQGQEKGMNEVGQALSAIRAQEQVLQQAQQYVPSFFSCAVIPWQCNNLFFIPDCLGQNPRPSKCITSFIPKFLYFVDICFNIYINIINNYRGNINT